MIHRVSNSLLEDHPCFAGAPDGAVAALRAHCGGSDPDKKALTAQRKPPAGEGRWSAEGTRQHPSSSPASSIPDRTPQRGCCCSARPEGIGTIEQPARGILALSDIVPHARAIPRYDFSAIAQAQGVPSAAQFHGWISIAPTPTARISNSMSIFGWPRDGPFASVASRPFISPTTRWEPRLPRTPTVN